MAFRLGFLIPSTGKMRQGDKEREMFGASGKDRGWSRLNVEAAGLIMNNEFAGRPAMDSKRTMVWTSGHQDRTHNGRLSIQSVPTGQDPCLSEHTLMVSYLWL